ncbi:hypothetical protein BB558_005580 [Smittium angustum]|uniref:1,3-beta-glucanosyltransferase n=1 Tax=Smittium angustum TaxID=133377 RepID=A0A2U1J044_SMIAN|nr:hypothetical protein BB558_005580 [Smittium angustum]
MKFLSLYLFSLLQTSAFASLNPLVIKGSKFFDSVTGEQFYFKGINYQPRTGATSKIQDPLADEVGCKRDAKIFAELKINSIRVYETDSSLNHDVCMKTLEDAGVYVMIDVPTPFYSVNREDPSWDIDMLNSHKLKVKEFSKYKNVVAFIIGNEVTNSKLNTPASAFIKAALRDIKTYLKSIKVSIPVGYVDNDDEDIRLSLISYFNCGDDQNARADFYGINTYRWCGPNATFKSSSFDKMIEPFKNYSIPSIITEFGCIGDEPRKFNEFKSILGPDMENISSGGLVYEYSQEENNYGLVKVSYGNSDIEKLKDLENLKNVLSSINPKGIKMNNYNPSNKISDCPPISDNWKVSKNLPPSPSEEACSCMIDSLSCNLDSEFSISDSSKAKSLGDTLSYICASISCSDVSHNTEKGEYGDFSFCNPVQRSAWILNANYINQKKQNSTCQFNNFKTEIINSPKNKDITQCNKLNNSVNNDPKSDNSNSTEGDSNNDDEGSNNNDGGSKNSDEGSSTSTKSSNQSNSQKYYTLNLALSTIVITALFCGVVY